MKESSPVRALVMCFHMAMDVPILDRPTVPPRDRLKLRLNLISEEFFEVVESCLQVSDSIRWRVIKGLLKSLIETAIIRVDMPSLADNLTDLDYVVEGTRLECGINGDEVLEEVHAANMRKVSGPIRSDGKRLKPPDWEPPDIVGVLRRQGWHAESL